MEMAVRAKRLGVLAACAVVIGAWNASPCLAISLGDLANKAQGAIKEGQQGKGSDPASTKSASSSTDAAKCPTPIFTGPKKRLAVMDMEVKVSITNTTDPTSSGGTVSTTTAYIPPPTDFGTGLTEMLTTALIDSGRFVLLERKALADIQAENSLASTPQVNQATAPGIGKLLAAQAMIRGAVTEYSYKRSSTGGSASLFQGVGLAASKAEASVVLDVRIYDVATSQILDSVKAEGRAKSSATSVSVDRPDYKMSASGFAQSPLGEATRQAIDKAVVFICDRMERMPWEGRIAEMDRDANGTISGLYLNAGSRLGLKEKDKLEILRPGRNITDPETNVVIGRTKDTRLGMCEIGIIKDSLSIASLTEGTDCQVGDIVRFVDPNAKPDSVLLPQPAPAPAPAPAPSSTEPSGTAPATDNAAGTTAPAQGQPAP